MPDRLPSVPRAGQLTELNTGARGDPLQRSTGAGKRHGLGEGDGAVGARGREVSPVVGLTPCICQRRSWREHWHADGGLGLLVVSDQDAVVVAHTLVEIHAGLRCLGVSFWETVFHRGGRGESGGGYSPGVVVPIDGRVRVEAEETEEVAAAEVQAGVGAAAREARVLDSGHGLRRHGDEGADGWVEIGREYLHDGRSCRRTRGGGGKIRWRREKGQKARGVVVGRVMMD